MEIGGGTYSPVVGSPRFSRIFAACRFTRLSGNTTSNSSPESEVWSKTSMDAGSWDGDFSSSNGRLSFRRDGSRRELGLFPAAARERHARHFSRPPAATAPPAEPTPLPKLPKAN